MRRIRFVHWNAAEAEERAERIRSLGYDVDAAPLVAPFSRFAERFDVVVIDLGRLPSLGRDVGVAVRIAKPTRSLPLGFVGGAPEKAALPRKLGIKVGTVVALVRARDGFRRPLGDDAVVRHGNGGKRD